MKNYVIGLAILVVLAAGALVVLLRSDAKPQQAAQPPSPAQTEAAQDFTAFPEPSPGAIVFDMKYRGLGGGRNTPSGSLGSPSWLPKMPTSLSTSS